MHFCVVRNSANEGEREWKTAGNENSNKSVRIKPGKLQIAKLRVCLGELGFDVCQSRDL